MRKIISAATRKSLLDDCLWLEAQLSPTARYPASEENAAHFRAMLASKRALLAGQAEK